jgi:hypothetical protein
VPGSSPFQTWDCALASNPNSVDASCTRTLRTPGKPSKQRPRRPASTATKRGCSNMPASLSGRGGLAPKSWFPPYPFLLTQIDCWHCVGPSCKSPILLRGKLPPPLGVGGGLASPHPTTSPRGGVTEGHSNGFTRVPHSWILSGPSLWVHACPP